MNGVVLDDEVKFDQCWLQAVQFKVEQAGVEVAGYVLPVGKTGRTVGRDGVVELVVITEVISLGVKGNSVFRVNGNGRVEVLAGPSPHLTLTENWVP